MSREAFPNPSRTYKTYKRAKKVIDGLEDGNYKWAICVTEEGKYFPHISYKAASIELTHFYFIEKGCCVTIE